MSTPILDVARELLTDEDAKSAFAEDPDGFLAARGLTDWEPGDVAEALGYVTESLPPATAAQLPSADTFLDGDVEGVEGLDRLGALSPNEGEGLLGPDTATLDGLEPGDPGEYGAGAGHGDGPEHEEGEGVLEDVAELPAEEPQAEDDSGEDPPPGDDGGEDPVPEDDGGEDAADPLSGLE